MIDRTLTLADISTLCDKYNLKVEDYGCKWTSGYMDLSWLDAPDENIIIMEGKGSRKGFLYYCEPSTRTVRFHFRHYLMVIDVQTGHALTLKELIRFKWFLMKRKVIR